MVAGLLHVNTGCPDKTKTTTDVKKTEEVKKDSSTVKKTEETKTEKTEKEKS